MYLGMYRYIYRWDRGTRRSCYVDSIYLRSPKVRVSYNVSTISAFMLCISKLQSIKSIRRSHFFHVSRSARIHQKFQLLHTNGRATYQRISMRRPMSQGCWDGRWKRGTISASISSTPESNNKWQPNGNTYRICTILTFHGRDGRLRVAATITRSPTYRLPNYQAQSLPRHAKSVHTYVARASIFPSLDRYACLGICTTIYTDL